MGGTWPPNAWCQAGCPSPTPEAPGATQARHRAPILPPVPCAPPRLRGPFCPPTPAQGGEPQVLWRARGPSPQLPPQPHAGGTAVCWGGGGGLGVLGQGGGQERGGPRLQEQQHKGEAARAPAQCVRDPAAPSARDGAAPSSPSPSLLCPAPGTGVPGCEPCPLPTPPPSSAHGHRFVVVVVWLCFWLFYGLQNSS